MRYLRGCCLGLVALSCSLSLPLLAQGYADDPAARAFVQRMVTEHGFAAAEVESILASAERQESILEAIARPAEKTKPWYEYRQIFLDQRRIDDGVAFWQQHTRVLERAEQKYGVPPQVITAIIGVETRYGKITGSYRVLDALATLGFDYPPRAAFFSKELEHFLLLTRDQKQDPTRLQGSYAGAMGYGQFMPSSYRAYAVDFDGDDKIDIWHNPVDAIGSVANYLAVHGWQAKAGVMVPAQRVKAFDEQQLNRIRKPTSSVAQLQQAGLVAQQGAVAPGDLALPLMFEVQGGKEYWLGLNNFYVITRYNHSPLYARAVWELAQAINEKH